MKESRESRFRRVMSGSDRTASAAMLRAAAACAEPIYAAVMGLRNALYDWGILPGHPLGRPTISVGNITTGGTGKTPIVRWMTRRLVAEGRKAVILMRGYKSTPGGNSDEAALLATPEIPVVVNPNRQAGAAAALQKYPQTTVFVLDDAMQHRSAARDFELVLIHAAEPFGFGRVFPRGFAREPLSGLRRADAVLITHGDEISAGRLQEIISEVRSNNKSAEILQCDHVISSLRSADEQSIPIENLSAKRYFAFCGIGSPSSFFRRLGDHGGISVGTREFDDHHNYDAGDMSAIMEAAKKSGAEMVITTEKDWVKVREFASQFSIPVFRSELSIRFRGDDEEKLWRLVSEVASNDKRPPTPQNTPRA